MLKFLGACVVFGVVAVAVGIWVTRAPGYSSSTAVVIVSGGAVFLIAAAAFHFLWRPMLAPFPPREPAPDAVRRRFQSFGVGIVNMGFSINVAVDDDYLHLIPLQLWQWLGARPASIPWDAMEPVGRSGRVVRVNGHRMDGPKWCLSLASPGDRPAGDPDPPG